VCLNCGNSLLCTLSRPRVLLQELNHEVSQ
jgi:hypothetical protein